MRVELVLAGSSVFERPEQATLRDPGGADPVRRSRRTPRCARTPGVRPFQWRDHRRTSSTFLLPRTFSIASAPKGMRTCRSVLARNLDRIEFVAPVRRERHHAVAAGLFEVDPTSSTHRPFCLRSEPRSCRLSGPGDPHVPGAHFQLQASPEENPVSKWSLPFMRPMALQPPPSRTPTTLHHVA